MSDSDGNDGGIESPPADQPFHLLQKGESKQRRTVNNSSGFKDLTKRHIDEQGACETTVKDFQ